MVASSNQLLPSVGQEAGQNVLHSCHLMPAHASKEALVECMQVGSFLGQETSLAHSAVHQEDSQLLAGAYMCVLLHTHCSSCSHSLHSGSIGSSSAILYSLISRMKFSLLNTV